MEGGCSLGKFAIASRRCGLIGVALTSTLGGWWLSFHAISPSIAPRVAGTVLLLVLGVLALPAASLAALAWHNHGRGAA